MQKMHPKFNGHDVKWLMKAHNFYYNGIQRNHLYDSISLAIEAQEEHLFPALHFKRHVSNIMSLTTNPNSRIKIQHNP